MQPELQKDVDVGLALPLMEAFYTIQGEGYYKGTAAFFVRIGGCDVGCHWCDVKESWDANLHPPTYIEEIVAKAKSYADTVVVTGGEPLMWNMKPITDALQSAGMKTHIETSGAYPLSGKWDWICLSPKKRMLPKAEIYDAADELKVIVYNKDDLQFAEKQAVGVSNTCKLYLQPEWSRRDTAIPLIVSHVLENPQWLASLQTHKYLKIP